MSASGAPGHEQTAQGTGKGASNDWLPMTCTLAKMGIHPAGVAGGENWEPCQPTRLLLAHLASLLHKDGAQLKRGTCKTPSLANTSIRMCKSLGPLHETTLEETTWANGEKNRTGQALHQAGKYEALGWMARVPQARLAAPLPQPPAASLAPMPAEHRPAFPLKLRPERPWQLPLQPFPRLLGSLEPQRALRLASS